MNRLTIQDFTITPLKNSKFVTPVRINYTQNNTKKTWEAVQAHESVAILLFEKESSSFILVKQFRPPVYMCDKSYPYTYELCAGIVDKDLSLKQIACEEILEECGYDLSINEISKITSFFTNVGVSGAKQHLYFAEVSKNQKIDEGGGVEGEEIILEYLPLHKAKEFIFDESKAKTPGLMFAFYWYFEKYK